MSFRIGDLGQSSRLGGYVQLIQTRIREAQTEIASGNRAQAYDEIADRAGLLVASRGQRALTERFIAENEKVIGRLQAMDGAVAGVGDLAQRLRTLLVTRLGEPGQSAIPLAAEIDQMAAELQSLLNRQLDGRYLFAGSRTDTPPVALPDPLPTTADPTTYYTGDEVQLTLRADVGIEIPYGLAANATPFADLFAALGQARVAHLADDRAGLETALQTASDALDGLAGERGALGVSSARIESIADGQRGTMLYLDDVIGQIATTDIAEAMTRLARDSANLEASYMVVARLNELSLAAYLR